MVFVLSFLLFGLRIYTVSSVRLLSYDIGCFSYFVLFSDCFVSSFEYELYRESLIIWAVILIMKRMFYHNPACCVFYVICFLTTWIVILGLSSLDGSKHCFSYNLAAIYANLASSFAYTSDVYCALILITGSWFLIFSESRYYEPFLLWISTTDLFHSKTFLSLVGYLLGCILFLVINHYRSVPVKAAIVRVPRGYFGVTPYTDDSLDHNIHINPYTGGVSRKYWDTIDGLPAKKITRFAISKLVFYENTTRTLSTSADTTVKFVGVCINKAHLLPPIVETKSPSAFERIFVVKDEEYGFKDVIRSQPTRVSLLCDCTRVPDQWALPLSSEEYKRMVHFSPVDQSPTIDLFRLGLFDLHALHPTSVHNVSSETELDCGECYRGSKYVLKQCIYFWCPLTSPWICSAAVAIPCIICCYCPILTGLSCWICCLP